MIVCAVFRYVWPIFTFAEDSMYGIPQDVINYRINGAGKRNGMEWSGTKSVISTIAYTTQ